MAGETFYTYLGGPRTFWGNSGSNIRINNNFCLPTCTPPLMMGGCGCGYNNFRMNNSLSIMAMFNNMMAQTIPYWNFSNTEGAGSSTASGSTTLLDKLTTARQTLDQIGFTQAAGYSLYLDESGNIIYRYSKDGKEYTASSMADLTAQITAGTSEGSGSSDSSISADDSRISVSDDSSVDSADEASETDTTDSGDVASSGHSTRKFKRGNPGVGFQWTTFKESTDKELKQKIQDKNCKTVVDLMKILMPTYFNDKEDAQIKGSVYYKLLMNANPSAIDNDGNIVNKDKLDIIVKRKTSHSSAASSPASNTTTVTVNGKQFQMIKDNNGRYTYKQGKDTINAATFANAAPEAFIKEHNRNWTAEDLQAILQVYDSKAIPGRNDSNKKHFESVHVSNSGNNIKISVYYKGNGVLSYWKWTSTFDCKDTNGKIKWDIADIYKDLNQGY